MIVLSLAPLHVKSIHVHLPTGVYKHLGEWIIIVGRMVFANQPTTYTYTEGDCIEYYIVFI